MTRPLTNEEVHWQEVEMHEIKCKFRVSWLYLKTLKWPFNWTEHLCSCNKKQEIDKWREQRFRENGTSDYFMRQY